MTTKPKGITLPSYTFIINDDTIALLGISSAGNKTAKDTWAIGPGTVRPWNLAPLTALSPVNFILRGQDAASSYASKGGDLQLTPGIGTGGNVSGNVTIQDSAGYAGWNTAHLVIGIYHLWIDGSGRLRVKSSAPASDTDGTIVGTQT